MGSATTTTTTTLKVSTVTSHMLPKKIVDIDPEDTDNNNANNVANHNSFAEAASTAAGKSLSAAQHSLSTPALASNTAEEEYTIFGYTFGARPKWLNIIGIVVIHTLFFYPVTLFPMVPRFYTVLWGFLMGGVGGFGVTAGAHRLWSHRAYKAKTPLRIILMLCFSLAGQNPLFDWVRDHRVHHKFSETSADPHDSNRGFFFAHVGWLMMLKHPEVVRKGKLLDMSDILNDPVVQFHQKYFIPLKLMMCFILPTVIPIYCWNEEFYWAFYSQCVLRYVMNLNFTWLVNSAAHMWGSKPYDTRIQPVQNLFVSVCAMGEGWHNYHHVFPWDYKAAELGNHVNLTTFLIDQFAKIGWAYDLKQPSDELVRKVAEKHGDNTHPVYGLGHSHAHMEEVPEPDDLQLKFKQT